MASSVICHYLNCQTGLGKSITRELISKFGRQVARPMGHETGAGVSRARDRGTFHVQLYVAAFVQNTCFYWTFPRKLSCIIFLRYKINEYDICFLLIYLHIFLFCSHKKKVINKTSRLWLYSISSELLRLI